MLFSSPLPTICWLSEHLVALVQMSTLSLELFPNPSPTPSRWEFLPSLPDTNRIPPWVCPRDSSHVLCSMPNHQLFPCLVPFLLLPYPWITPPCIQWLNPCHHILCHLSIFPASSLIQPSLTDELGNALWTFLFSSSLFQFRNWFWSNRLLIHCVLCFSLLLHSANSRVIFLKYRFAAHFWSFP